MLALWARIVIVGLLLIHGLAHWNLPTLWGEGSTGGSWLLGDSAAALGIGDLLWSATLVVLVSAAILLALGRASWRPAAVAGGLLSIATMVLFWDGVFAYGLVVDIVFIATLVLPPTYERLAHLLRFGADEGLFGGSRGPFGGSKGVRA
jgi:uncharacterized membrane protein YphA (DoxX/SURF4 family)